MTKRTVEIKTGRCWPNAGKALTLAMLSNPTRSHARFRTQPLPPTIRLHTIAAFTLIEVLAALVVLALLTLTATTWFRSASAGQEGAKRHLEAQQIAMDLAAAQPLPHDPQLVPGHADLWWRVVDLRGSGSTHRADAHEHNLAHHWRHVIICSGRDLRAPILADALVMVLNE